MSKNFGRLLRVSGQPRQRAPLNPKLAKCQVIFVHQAVTVTVLCAGSLPILEWLLPMLFVSIIHRQTAIVFVVTANAIDRNPNMCRIPAKLEWLLSMFFSPFVPYHTPGCVTVKDCFSLIKGVWVRGPLLWEISGLGDWIFSCKGCSHVWYHFSTIFPCLKTTLTWVGLPAVDSLSGWMVLVVRQRKGSLLIHSN